MVKREREVQQSEGPRINRHCGEDREKKWAEKVEKYKGENKDI